MDVNAPPAYAPSAPPPQPGMYPQVNQGQYQPVPTDEKNPNAFAYPAQQAVAYQPTTTMVVGPGGQLPPGAVVVVQQQTMPQDPRLHKIKDLLPLSIVTTICCSLLFGIIAIVFSIRVRDCKHHNDYEGAKKAYKIMLAMNITGICLSAIIIIIVIIVQVTATAAVYQSVSSGRNY